jgi:hypothetical protein
MFSLSVPGGMSDNDARILGAVYLFLSADGQITGEEIELFNAIGNRFEGWGAAKTAIANECKKLLSGNKKESYGIVEKTFVEFLESGTGYWTIGLDNTTKTYILSLFVSLLY